VAQHHIFPRPLCFPNANTLPAAIVHDIAYSAHSFHCRCRCSHSFRKHHTVILFLHKTPFYTNTFLVHSSNRTTSSTNPHTSTNIYVPCCSSQLQSASGTLTFQIFQASPFFFLDANRSIIFHHASRLFCSCSFAASSIPTIRKSCSRCR
jgi:hypothetical protein